MSDTITFTVLGDPKAQKRHRTFRHGGFLRQVDPSEPDKANFLAQVRQYAPAAPWTEPLFLHLAFVIARPKGHYGSGRNAQVIKPAYAKAQPTGKPDIDNLVKLVQDALAGVFYRDDQQIVELHATKEYGPVPERPRTEVRIWKL